MFRRMMFFGLGGLLALGNMAATAHAIPAFARMHGVSCSLCHDPMPRLNKFGEMFAANGYRFSPGQPLPDGIDTGDPLLELPDRLRLAMRVDAYITAYTNGTLDTDFQTPYNVKVMSGGPLGQHLSYYVYFLLSERGETGGIEDAYLTWSGIAGTPLSVSVGQFQVSDPMFPREVRLEYQDYAIYRARIGDSPVNLTYDRGLMLRADVGGFGLTGGVVNGNGSGAAGDNRRLDNDRNKSVLLHARRDVVSGVTLGALGYFARQQGAAPDGPTLTDKVWMLGGDVTIGFGPVEVRGQFIHREDSQPTFTLDEPTAVTNGGWGEVLFHEPNSRWYAVALYNRVDTNLPLLDVRLGGPKGLSRYEAVTGGVGYLLLRNLRVYGEGTWDRGSKTTQWTAGFTTAF